jgi:IS30 family transposase
LLADLQVCKWHILKGTLKQSMTETEIAEELNVDQSTISRDIKALKEISQQFVFDLQNLI